MTATEGTERGLATKPVLLYVTTYSPERSYRGGASWVDKKIIGALSERFEIRVLTLEQLGIRIEVSKDWRALTQVALQAVTKMQPYQVAKYSYQAAWRRAAHELSEHLDAADFSLTSQWPALELLSTNGFAPSVHIAHNADFVQSQQHDPWPLRVLRHDRLVAAAEIRALRMPHHNLALSATDAKRFRAHGIDIEHLDLTSQFRPRTAVPGRQHVGFIGKMSWPPNRQAITELAERVLPACRQHVRLVVAGDGSDHILESVDKEIIRLGRLPDLAPFYDAIDIVAIPRLGLTTGVSVKLFEALDLGLPAIVPTQLWEDSGRPSGCIIADTAADAAAALDHFFDQRTRQTFEQPVSATEASVHRNSLRLINLASHISQGPERAPIHSIGGLMDHLANKLIVNREQLLSALLESDGPGRIQTINLHHLQLMQTDTAFRTASMNADRVTADGWPVALAFRAMGVRTARVTGSDLAVDLLTATGWAGRRLAILGEDQPVADHYVERLQTCGASVVFREHGHRDGWNLAAIAERLNDAAVDILLLAVTPPDGEVIGDTLMRSGFNGKAINVGGGIRMATGARTRAPKLLQKAGLEWLYRLSRDPLRLSRRYLIEGLPFFVLHLLPVIIRTSVRTSSRTRPND